MVQKKAMPSKVVEETRLSETSETEEDRLKTKGQNEGLGR